MQLNLTLSLTFNLRWNLNVNVDLSMLRLSRCPGSLPYYGHCSVMIKWWCNPPWSLSLLVLLSLQSLLLLLLSLASIAFSKLSLFFLITSDLNRHFSATASPGIEDRAFTQPLCSQDIHITFKPNGWFCFYASMTSIITWDPLQLKPASILLVAVCRWLWFLALALWVVGRTERRNVMNTITWNYCK